jgi:hypothetical protein
MSRHGRLQAAALCLMLCVGAATASAQEGGASIPEIARGARPMGMGEAFTANASGNGAIYHNPAGVSSTQMFAIEGAYALIPGLNAFNISVVDSKLNQNLSAGLSYSYVLTTEDDSQLQGHDARLVLGSRPHPDVVLGIGGRYLTFKDKDLELLEGFTLDLGAIYRITQGVFIGVAGNNLLDVCNGDKDNSCPADAAPRILRGGLAFGSSLGFQLSADAQARLDGDEVQMVWASGLELLIQQLVALRGGYRYDQAADAHLLTGGLGIKSWQFGMDLSYQHNLQSDDYLFSAAIQLYPNL